MKKFKYSELSGNQLQSVSGGADVLGKTQTTESYSQETARDRDSKKETKPKEDELNFG